MMKPADVHVTFHVEPADPSVGIMAEGFSAWDDAGTSWCDLREIVYVPDHDEEYVFEWIGNETGDTVEPPPDAPLIETMLAAFVRAWYVNHG